MSEQGRVPSMFVSRTHEGGEALEHVSWINCGSTFPGGIRGQVGWPQARWSSGMCPCPWQGGGLHDLSSFQTQTIL